MHTLRAIQFGVTSALACLSLMSSAIAQAPKAGGSLPSVIVQEVAEKDVTPEFRYVGRVVAVDSVPVRARVTGIIEKRNFIEGRTVKKGQTLFEIERPPYEVVVEQRKAELASAQASLVNATADFKRKMSLQGRDVVSKLIVGCGYVGTRLARYWVDRGEDVWVTSRSPDRAKDLSRQGFRPIVLDVTQKKEYILPPVESIVFAVGYDRSSSQSIEEVYVEGLRRIAANCPKTIRRFIYLSSTGVYGQTNGNWVDEYSPCEPIREGGAACLAAEKLLQADARLADKTMILRLAGIYGPGRLPHMKALVSGEPLRVAADGHLNLIHVDDIIQVIAECELSIQPPQLLCVADGHPVRRADFYDYLAGLLGAEAPTFSPPVPNSPRAARSRGSKRIRNQRLIGRMSAGLCYPNYREGLAAIVADGKL